MVSTNRGNHFIFEDDTFEWANSVGLDIGNEDWGASRPPQPVGFDVVRGNTFRYCGIEGLGGTGGPQSTLVEKNLFEWIGWQNAAMMSESGGTKMHNAQNLALPQQRGAAHPACQRHLARYRQCQCTASPAMCLPTFPAT